MRRRSYVGAWARETEVSYKNCPTHVPLSTHVPTHVGVETQGTDAPLKDVGAYIIRSGRAAILQATGYWLLLGTTPPT